MKTFLFLTTCLILVVSANSSSAGVQFGPEGDWNKFSNVASGDWGIGARLDAGGDFRFIGSFDYYFVNTDILGPNNIFTGTPNTNLKFYEINLNAAYRFPTEGVQPYLGGGISISKRTFNNVTLGNFFDDNKTQIGGNVFG
ncbi:MAG: hypothetical protein C5B54_11100, partial [Acidobacteria bacterium]